MFCVNICFLYPEDSQQKCVFVYGGRHVGSLCFIFHRTQNIHLLFCLFFSVIAYLLQHVWRRLIRWASFIYNMLIPKRKPLGFLVLMFHSFLLRERQWLSRFIASSWGVTVKSAWRQDPGGSSSLLTQIWPIRALWFMWDFPLYPCARDTWMASKAKVRFHVYIPTNSPTLPHAHIPLSFLPSLSIFQPPALPFHITHMGELAQGTPPSSNLLPQDDGGGG